MRFRACIPKFQCAAAASISSHCWPYLRRADKDRELKSNEEGERRGQAEEFGEDKIAVRTNRQIGMSIVTLTVGWLLVHDNKHFKSFATTINIGPYALAIFEQGLAKWAPKY